jgi:hypothetical protein
VPYYSAQEFPGDEVLQGMKIVLECSVEMASDAYICRRSSFKRKDERETWMSGTPVNILALLCPQRCTSGFCRRILIDVPYAEGILMKDHAVHHASGNPEGSSALRRKDDNDHQFLISLYPPLVEDQKDFEKFNHKQVYGLEPHRN